MPRDDLIEDECSELLRCDLIEDDDKIRSEPEMPPLGVCHLLAPDSVDGPDQLRFWLLTHNSFDGKRFWRVAVLRECLPAADDGLEFEALGTPW